jgi:hypothetical protein
MAAAFLGAGGGVAFLLHRTAGIGVPLSFVIGGAAGLVFAGGLFAIFVKVFLANSGGQARSAYDLVDSLATVSVTLPVRGTGRIDFVASGRRQTMAARSATGEAIPKGSPVVVLRLENGVAYVADTGDALSERK